MRYIVSKEGTPILSKQKIEELATEFLMGFDGSYLIKAKPLPIEEIIERHVGLDFDYKHIEKNESVLGLISFNDGYVPVYNPEKDNDEQIWVAKGTIIIDSRLAENSGHEGRYRFTCSHELAHWLLHRQLYEENEQQPRLFDVEDGEKQNIKCLNRYIERAFDYSRAELKTKHDWLEWQADYMSSAILMPAYTLKKEFYSILKKLDIRDPYLYLDKQPCNISNFKTVVYELMEKFKVSKQAIEIRMRKLGLLLTEPGQILIS